MKAHSTWRSGGPAVWIAIAALVVALGGTATAARTLIGGNDIANGAIKVRHIAPNAVTLAKNRRARTEGAVRPDCPARRGPPVPRARPGASTSAS